MEPGTFTSLRLRRRARLLRIRHLLVQTRVFECRHDLAVYSLYTHGFNRRYNDDFPPTGIPTRFLIICHRVKSGAVSVSVQDHRAAQIVEPFEGFLCKALQGRG